MQLRTSFRNAHFSSLRQAQTNAPHYVMGGIRLCLPQGGKMGISKTGPQLHGPWLRLQSVTLKRSSGSSFKLHAAAIAVCMLLFLVSSLRAATTIVAVCGLGPGQKNRGGGAPAAVALGV